MPFVDVWRSLLNYAYIINIWILRKNLGPSAKWRRIPENQNELWIEQTNRQRRHSEIYKKQKNGLARSRDADGWQENILWITNRCSYMQSILFHCYVHSICFGCFTHPSSGVQYQATLGVSSWDDTMVCASGCRYSFLKLYSWWWVYKTPETCRVNLAVE